MEQVLNRTAFTSDLSYGVYLSEIADLRCAAVAPAQPCAPHILEALSYHANERDDLTLEDAVKAFRFGWKDVRGRSVREMLAQLIELMASAPELTTQSATPASPSERKPLTDEEVIELLLDGILTNSGTALLRDGRDLLFNLEELADFANKVREHCGLAPTVGSERKPLTAGQDQAKAEQHRSDLVTLPPQWKTVADQLNQLDKMLAEVCLTRKHRSRQLLYRILHDVCGMPAAPSERESLSPDERSAP